MEACFSAWHGADGLQYGAILRDITVRKREAERIRYLAEYDTLTGLANRNTLQAGLAAMIGSTEKSAGGIVLLVLGLDGFMNINDILGHAAGDRVLQAVAQRLKEEAGQDGLVARLSGDEFAIADAARGAAISGQRVCRAYRRGLRPAAVRRIARTSHQDLDRRCRLSGKRTRRRRAAEQRSPGVLPRQGAAARRPCDVRQFDAPGARGAGDAGSRACARGRARRVRAVLPAAGAPRRRPPERRGGADPLAPSRARAGGADRSSCPWSTPPPSRSGSRCG